MTDDHYLTIHFQKADVGQVFGAKKTIQHYAQRTGKNGIKIAISGDKRELHLSGQRIDAATIENLLKQQSATFTIATPDTTPTADTAIARLQEDYARLAREATDLREQNQFYLDEHRAMEREHRATLVENARLTAANADLEARVGNGSAPETAHEAILAYFAQQQSTVAALADYHAAIADATDMNAVIARFAALGIPGMSRHRIEQFIAQATPERLEHIFQMQRMEETMAYNKDAGIIASYEQELERFRASPKDEAKQSLIAFIEQSMAERRASRAAYEERKASHLASTKDAIRSFADAKQAEATAAELGGINATLPVYIRATPEGTVVRIPARTPSPVYDAFLVHATGAAGTVGDDGFIRYDATGDDLAARIDAAFANTPLARAGCTLQVIRIDDTGIAAHGAPARPRLEPMAAAAPQALSGDLKEIVYAACRRHAHEPTFIGPILEEVCQQAGEVSRQRIRRQLQALHEEGRISIIGEGTHPRYHIT